MEGHLGYFRVLALANAKRRFTTWWVSVCTISDLSATMLELPRLKSLLSWKNAQQLKIIQRAEHRRTPEKHGRPAPVKGKKEATFLPQSDLSNSIHVCWHFRKMPELQWKKPWYSQIQLVLRSPTLPSLSVFHPSRWSCHRVLKVQTPLGPGTGQLD